MNLGLMQGFTYPSAEDYPTALLGRVMLGRINALSSSDAGKLLIFPKDLGGTVPQPTLVVPASGQASFDPFTFIHVAYRGATYLNITFPAQGTVRVLGKYDAAAASSSWRLYGPAGLLTLIKGFNADWYLAGSGLTT